MNYKYFDIGSFRRAQLCNHQVPNNATEVMNFFGTQFTHNEQCVGSGIEYFLPLRSWSNKYASSDATS